MKRFKLHGNTAFWNGLKLTALNLATLQEEITSAIPYGKRMYVNVVDNLYEVTDPRKEVLQGEVSTEDKEYILNKVKTATPNFLLSLNGKVVGYASLHHRHGYKDAATPTPINVDDIIDADLGILIIPATATEPARKKAETKDYIVRQEITISVYQRVSATSEKEATEKAIDLLCKVETFLDENFESDDDGNDYVTSDYYTEAYEV